MVFAFALVLLITEIQGLNEVCYGKYGCFNDQGPFQGIFTQLPASPAVVNTKFRLFTRRTPSIFLEGESLDDTKSIKLHSSTFNKKAPTKIIIHGYIEPKFGVKDWMLGMKNELLIFDDVNVILVSWTGGNQFPYIQAAANTRIVGSMVSEFVLFLVNQTTTPCDQIHLIGFSLGSHIAGYAGKRSINQGCMFARITGLDPAGPLFESDSPAVRLHHYDAIFVDVIHTDTRITSLGIVGSFGLTRSIGDVDFYPNGGYHQPGCQDVTFDLNFIQTIKDLVVCSHARAVQYFNESINGQCQMRGYPCTSKRLFEDGKCSSCKTNECQLMGFHARKTKEKFPVKYYLKTNSDSFFCGYHYIITIYTVDSFRGGLESEIYVTLTGTNGSEKDIELEQRDHNRGSSQSFVVLTKSDIGDLMKIKIWHNKYAFWNLHYVTVKPGWSSKQYTACIQSWLTFIYSSHEVKFQKGVQACA